MQYKNINGLDKKVSKIVFGTASKVFIEGSNQNDLLDKIFGLGINTFDTARNYGLSEQSIGMWFKQNKNRQDVVLLSKCGHPDTTSGKDRISKEEIFDDLQTSLSLLNTDYIDIYLLHRDDPKVDVSVIVDIFNELYNQGKIKIYGVSNWTSQRIKEANNYALSHNLQPISISSPNYCVASKVINPWLGECVTLCGDDNKSQRDYYIGNQMPVFAYSSLGRGMFAGKVNSNNRDNYKSLDEFACKSFYNSENIEVLKRCESLAIQKHVNVNQIALAYLMNSKLNVFPIISSSSIASIVNNIDSLNINLTQEEMDYINKE